KCTPDVTQQEQQLATLCSSLRDLATRQDSMIQSLGSQVHMLLEKLDNAALTAAAPNVGPDPPPIVAAATPPLHRFSGDSGDIKPFLTQCDLHFELQAAAFPTERSKIAFIISHLSGRAEAWATAEWSRRASSCASLADFTRALTQIFQHTSPGQEAARAIIHHVRSQTIEWNAAALADAFLQGLSGSIKDHLVIDLPEDLDSLIAVTIKIDKRLTEWDQDRGRPPVRTSTHRSGRGALPDRPNRLRLLSISFTPPSDTREEPMQQWDGCCFYCSLLGHQVADCHIKASKYGLKTAVRVSKNTVILNPVHYEVKVNFHSNTASMVVPTFVDSGSDTNLMNLSLVRSLDLSQLQLQRPLEVKAVDDNPLGRITHHTQSVKVTFPDNHTESISFHVFPAMSHLGQVLSWGQVCYQSCFIPQPALAHQDPDLSWVPACYHDLASVFSKANAKSLPPHRPYDCCIDLLPRATPSRGRLFSLSSPERQAMEEYIQDSLVAGIIRPSSSPAGAGFFFVEKKDKSLRPCIDYRGLNDITIKNRYPLPLISTAFELLEGPQAPDRLVDPPLPPSPLFPPAPPPARRRPHRPPLLSLLPPSPPVAHIPLPRLRPPLPLPPLRLEPPPPLSEPSPPPAPPDRASPSPAPPGSPPWSCCCSWACERGGGTR
uniref:Ty3 transposon capsid-like protein domain-containing protein n=1 Tax=Seriola lalandi dorsalis TaxID=1841481 RepID=A0A3B4X4G4_SERLL